MNAPNPSVSVGNVRFANDAPLALIAGPCQLESRQHAYDMAGSLKEICARLGVGLVYKTSFDKANRTSLSGRRGAGLEAALPIFADLRRDLDLPLLTDVHTEEQCAVVAEAADILQIPAFLSRQTDLLIAAARTGRVVNVKKGQFLAPWDMRHVVAKVTGSGNANVLLTERGASFGYNTLVSDMRALPIMAETGAPVIFDATHSVQQPGGQGASSGGDRRFVETLARAAVAVGVAGIFVETHQDPDNAPSDGPNMVPLKEFKALLETLQAYGVETPIRVIPTGLDVHRFRSGDGPRGGFFGGSGGAGFGAGGGVGVARNFDLNIMRVRSARRPRLRRFFALRFFRGFMKRESARRNVGMNVGTSSGGSSGMSPSLSVAASLPVCGGDKLASSM